MRTTLSLDDDVLDAARELASAQRRTLGEVVSELARRSLAISPTARRVRNGVPLLPGRAHAPRVTSALIRRLDEDLP